MTITVQDIIDAICDTLYEKFGSSFKIYTSQVDQNLQEPCFYVKCINPVQTRDLDRRFRKTNQFSVQYFPSDRGVNSTLYGKAEDLQDILCDLTVEKTESGSTKTKILHGTEFGINITDEILTVTVNYDLFILQEYSPTDMEVLEEVDVGQKG